MAPKDSTLPIDPNVRVPDAVKRAAARAEAHYQPANPDPSQVQPAAPVQVQPLQPAPPAPQPAPAAPEPAPQCRLRLRNLRITSICTIR